MIYIYLYNVVVSVIRMAKKNDKKWKMVFINFFLLFVHVHFEFLYEEFFALVRKFRNLAIIFLRGVRDDAVVTQA